MANYWVYKLNGAVQCDQDLVAISLDEMRIQLSKIIGEHNISNMENRQLIMPRVCGWPTGQANAYEITEEGWFILNRGIVGRSGFNLWPTSSAEGTEVGMAETIEAQTIGAQTIGALTTGNPVFIRELVGHPLRVFKTGDPLTDDWRPDRCNIETNDKKVIVNIWFG